MRNAFKLSIFRQEFGSSEVQPGPDSGYVSHSSGGGYPKLLVQPVKRFKKLEIRLKRNFIFRAKIQSSHSQCLWIEAFMEDLPSQQAH